MPHLSHPSRRRAGSYTFVTGDSDEAKGLAQVNAQAMRGLCTALRNEETSASIAEVRVRLKLDRSPEERQADPRSSPLSHDLGAIAAGLAGSLTGDAAGLHTIEKMSDVAAMRERFPSLDEPFAVHASSTNAAT
jgi:hypothetical protein